MFNPYYCQSEDVNKYQDDLEPELTGLDAFTSLVKPQTNTLTHCHRNIKSRPSFLGLEKADFAEGGGGKAHFRLRDKSITMS